MEATMTLEGYALARYNLFRWRYQLSILQKIAFCLGFACITGLLAQVRFHIPWTPVPVTGQTFAVLLAGVLLGRWGGLSQLMYIGLGVAGIPWFSGWTGGVAILAGPTGGYIIGFAVTAFFLGHFVDAYVRSRSFINMFGLMLFANFIIIHGLGVFHLYFLLAFFKGTAPGFSELLMMGTIPFIAGDLVKIVLAAAIACGITPKTPFNREA